MSEVFQPQNEVTKEEIRANIQGIPDLENFFQIAEGMGVVAPSELPKIDAVANAWVGTPLEVVK